MHQLARSDPVPYEEPEDGRAALRARVSHQALQNEYAIGLRNCEKRLSGARGEQQGRLLVRVALSKYHAQLTCDPW